MANHSKAERAVLVTTAISSLQHLRTHLISTLSHLNHSAGAAGVKRPFDATQSFMIVNFVRAPLGIHSNPRQPSKQSLRFHAACP